MTRDTIDPFTAFYRTRAMPCPYLEGRRESRIFTELAGDAPALYEALAHAGFRRSHRMAYRPACPECDACVPVRVVADEFAPSRNQRRILKANADLSERVITAHATREQYELFARYLDSRHSDGDMAAMDYMDYRAMVEESPVDTSITEYRDAGGRLVAGCLWDRMGDGLSAVYSFFEPDEPKRGLGNFVVLRLIGQAKGEGLPYVYLGYWIAESRKMSYKDRFRPIEALTGEGWRRLRG